MKGSLMGVRHARASVVCFAGIVLATVSLSHAEAYAQGARDAATDELNLEALGAGQGAALQSELDSYVQSALVAFDVPAAAVAVLKDGKVAYRGAFGVRGARRTTPVDTRTLFMVGSITKSMTSTMVATLVDDKIVGWDAPVAPLLPTFALAQPEYESSVTLRHLLSHQSAVPNARSSCSKRSASRRCALRPDKATSTKIRPTHWPASLRPALRARAIRMVACIASTNG
jgi:CubicO group peptidase (beta-lactamase class C family)